MPEEDTALCSEASDSFDDRGVMWWWKVAGDSPGPERNCGERVGVRKSEGELEPVREDEDRISS